LMQSIKGDAKKFWSSFAPFVYLTKDVYFIAEPLYVTWRLSPV
jgi:hypothetical protein